MRKLSTEFMDTLSSGFLSEIKNKVIEDKDLDLQIRENYLNIYYKGNSLVKLDEINSEQYSLDIHEKFLKNVEVKDLVDERTTKKFIKQIPKLKENIVKYGVKSLELE